MPEELNQPGLIPDPRSDEDKARDYQHGEVAPMAIKLNWNRDISQAPTYSQRDQDGSGSCVAQSSAKDLEILRKEIISAHPIYARRKNLGSMGMWLQDAGDIVKKLGTTTESLDPSQKMSETDMNKSVTVDTPINEYLYAFPDIHNIDKIAEAIEVYGHCSITVACEGGEWTEKPLYNGKTPNFFHCVSANYYFTDENGNKCIRIDESWGVNNPGHRILTEAFLLARGTGAMYHIPPVVDPPAPSKPKFTFQNPLEYGWSNYSIKNLQDILKYENLFPINIVSTGYYGEITRKAIYQWQVKHAVDTPEALNALQGRRIGQKSIKVLNSIYS